MSAVVLLAALHAGLFTPPVVEGFVRDTMGRGVRAGITAVCGDAVHEVDSDARGWFEIHLGRPATCDLTVRGPTLRIHHVRGVLPGRPPVVLVVQQHAAPGVPAHSIRLP